MPTWKLSRASSMPQCEVAISAVSNLREASILLRKRRLLALVAPQLLNQRVRALLAGCGRPHHQPVGYDQVCQQAPQPRSLHACRFIRVVCFTRNMPLLAWVFVALAWVFVAHQQASHRWQ